MPDEFDYLVIGGGSAGAVAAARLAEDGDATVCLVEAGPSDEGLPEILELPRWPELLQSRFDYDYAIEPQERGNSDIRQSRARVLGGCGSHNVCQAWRAPEYDLREWEELGASGWGPDGTRRYFDRVFERTGLEHDSPDNDAAAAFIEACKQAGYSGAPLGRGRRARGHRLGSGERPRAGCAARRQSPTCTRSPSCRTTSTVRTDTQALRLLLEGGEAVGVETSGRRAAEPGAR